jgi:hypothetical protein
MSINTYIFFWNFQRVIAGDQLRHDGLSLLAVQDTIQT